MKRGRCIFDAFMGKFAAYETCLLSAPGSFFWLVSSLASGFVVLSHRRSSVPRFCVCYSLLSSWAYLWPLPSFSSSFWPGFFPLVASFDSCSSKPFLFFSALPPAHTQFLLWKQSVDFAYSPFVALVVVYIYFFFGLISSLFIIITIIFIITALLFGCLKLCFARIFPILPISFCFLFRI